jgi:hypothetical protein
VVISATSLGISVFALRVDDGLDERLVEGILEIIAAALSTKRIELELVHARERVKAPACGSVAISLP